MIYIYIFFTEGRSIHHGTPSVMAESTQISLSWQKAKTGKEKDLAVIKDDMNKRGTMGISKDDSV